MIVAALCPTIVNDPALPVTAAPAELVDAPVLISPVIESEPPEIVYDPLVLLPLAMKSPLAMLTAAVPDWVNVPLAPGLVPLALRPTKNASRPSALPSAFVPC